MKNNALKHQLEILEYDNEKIWLFEDILSPRFDIFAVRLFSYRVVVDSEIEEVLSRSNDLKSFLYFQSRNSNIPLVLLKKNPILALNPTDKIPLDGVLEGKGLNSKIKEYLSFWFKYHHREHTTLSLNTLAIFALFNRLLNFDDNYDIEELNVHDLFEDYSPEKYEDVVSLARQDFHSLNFPEFSHSSDLARYTLQHVYVRDYNLEDSSCPPESLRDLISLAFVSPERSSRTVPFSYFDFGTLKRLITMHKVLPKELVFEEKSLNDFHLNFLTSFTQSCFFDNEQFLKNLAENSKKFGKTNKVGFVFALTFVDMFAQVDTVDTLKSKLSDELSHCDSKTEFLDFNCIAESSKKFVECDGRIPFSMLTNITYGV